MRKPLVTAALLILLSVFGAFAVTSSAAAKTLTYKGSGDKIVKIAKPSGKQGEAVVVKISSSGSSNFIVEALDKKLKTTALLVNTIGTYKGTVPLDFQGQTVTYRLKIQAQGSWTATVKPLSSVRHFSGKIAGRGDDVVLYKGGAKVATIKHSGTSNFIVMAYNKDGADLLVNEIGKYKGQSVLSQTSYVTITADGAWSIVAK